jgi:hypothetical protein
MTKNTNEMTLNRVITISSNPLENRVIKIDNEVVNKGRRHTFDEWTKIQSKRGRFVISRADIYQAVKEGNKKLIESLRKDMEESWIVSNPLHVYKDNLFTDIIHYASSKNPVICRNLIVPFWVMEPLYDVLETAEGLAYFQVTNGTRDNAKAIKKTYYELSGCKADETFVCTPHQYIREDNRSEMVFSAFYYGSNGEFLVDCKGGLFNGGRSRGVRVSTAKKFHGK